MTGPLASLADALEAAAAAARTEIGRTGKKIAADELARDIGGTALSHFGSRRRRGQVKLSTGYEIDGDRVTLTPRPLGVWQLVSEGSSKGHWYIPRRRQFTKTGKIRKGARPVSLGPGRAYWWVSHPGVRGHGTWDRVRSEIILAVRPITVAAVAGAL